MAAARMVAWALCRQFTPRNVLDLGAGKGFVVDAFRERDVDAWGVDSAVAVVNRRVLLCDLEQEPLPWPDDSFDLVTCIEVAEHVRTLGWLSEATRVLRPGGVFWLQTPNPWSRAARSDPTHAAVRPFWQWRRDAAARGLRWRPKPLVEMDDALPLGALGRRLPPWIRFPWLSWPAALIGTRHVFRKGNPR